MWRHQIYRIVAIVALLVFANVLHWANGKAEQPAQREKPRVATVHGTQVKVICFDCFGTVFDFRGAKRSSISHYASQIKASEWKPLKTPEEWKNLPAWPDAANGIKRLREGGYTVVTLSNGPLQLLAGMSKTNGIHWDAIVPIELKQVYKPNLQAYRVVETLFDCKPSEIMIVTANPGFGDIEAAQSLGWQTTVIRNPHYLKDIEALADYMLPEKGVNYGEK